MFYYYAINNYSLTGQLQLVCVCVCVSCGKAIFPSAQYFITKVYKSMLSKVSHITQHPFIRHMHVVACLLTCCLICTITYIGKSIAKAALFSDHTQFCAFCFHATRKLLLAVCVCVCVLLPPCLAIELLATNCTLFFPLYR